VVQIGIYVTFIFIFNSNKSYVGEYWNSW